MSVKTNYTEIQPKLEEGVEEGREKLLYRLQNKPYHKHFRCLIKKNTRFLKTQIHVLIHFSRK